MWCPRVRRTQRHQRVDVMFAKEMEHDDGEGRGYGPPTLRALTFRYQRQATGELQNVFTRDTREGVWEGLLEAGTALMKPES